MKEENYKIIDEDRVEKVSKNILDDDFLVNVAELFKVFGDSSRIKIICALLQEELCVGDIAAITKSTSVNAVSGSVVATKLISGAFSFNKISQASATCFWRSSLLS